MLINLWSTPRTGSNWYSQYLYKKYISENQRTILYNQFLNYYHLINYTKPNYNDFVYEYDRGCSFKSYEFDYLREAITYTHIQKQRQRNSHDEEKYRLELLTKHNHKKNPSIFYSHVAPMSNLAYSTLFEMADKNIFLYRKDIKRQVSSYALAYGTTQYKPNKAQVYEDVNVDYGVIKNLVDRIILWYQLDKTNCEVVCFENLEFGFDSTLPKQQNKLDPFNQLSVDTQKHILNLLDYFSLQVGKIS